MPKPTLVQEVQQQEQMDPPEKPTPSHLHVYTRPQLLHLYESPLVKPPAAMPVLKDWFGAENEQHLHKRDSEPSNANAPKDRRFRRDPEDGEAPPRPSFRSTLSQPSQMGNFKHQSVRTADRERDTDKDRERDIRDREGQERLRNLSDKYDRDRLAHPLNPTGIRTKDRDTAPHLAAGTSRSTAQPQSTAATSRRGEPREPRDATKKKAGESSEDWRRENGPKDRDERERPRSRVRDSSRPRDRDRRGDDHSRRERELDRDLDLDESRRWKEETKREERLTTRRDRDRARDRGTNEAASEGSQDRRWTVVEERDGRPKRGSGRDRRQGGAVEEGRDNDRRDREREKEKEPAWMDAYIPSTTGGGILGGKGVDGELDGIQAWKKGMKEKENTTLQEDSNGTVAPTASNMNGTEKPLDEIQLFKLLMKREEDKRNGEALPNDVLAGLLQARPDHGPSSPPTKQDAKLVNGDTAFFNSHPPGLSSSPLPQATQETKSIPAKADEAPSNPSQSLLSILISPSNASLNISHPAPNPPNSSLDSFADVGKPSGSRFFPRPTPNDPSSLGTSAEKNVVDSNSNTSGFQPPQGSRLLALGARNLSQPPLHENKLPLASTPSMTPQFSGEETHTSLASNFESLKTPSPPHPDLPNNTKSEHLRSRQAFSPFEEHSRMLRVEESQETGVPSVLAASERGPAAGSSENGHYLDNTTSPMADVINGAGVGSAYTAGRGSRFAKFFDGKARDGVQATSKTSTPLGYPLQAYPGNRHDNGSLGGIVQGNADNRAMDDIYAMLSNSTQGPRHNMMTSGGNSMGPGHPNTLSMQQQHLQQHQPQPHFPPMGRLESLYDSGPEDRNFTPDGLVPGLRSAPPQRTRENGGFADPINDTMHFNSQRIPPQSRGLDQMFPGSMPSMFNHQGAVGRQMGVLPPQQQQYRNGPSPVSGQNPLHGAPHQRLPPGLANLGGRPPHEPSQFLGMPGMPSGGLHNNTSAPQSFSNFGGGLNYGSPPMRAPPPNLQQLQNPISQNPMNPLGHLGNMDLRGPNPAQMLGMSGGMRGIGGGFAPQQGPIGQMQAPLVGMRHQQQQQQHLPPHMMPHHLFPAHLQQQGLSGSNPQPTHDLMALLMGGTNRE